MSKRLSALWLGVLLEIRVGKEGIDELSLVPSRWLEKQPSILGWLTGYRTV